MIVKVKNREFNELGKQFTCSLLALLQSDFLQLRESLAFEPQSVVEYQRSGVNLVRVGFLLWGFPSYDRSLLIQSDVRIRFVVVEAAIPARFSIFN